MTIRLICSSIYYISNHCNTTNVPGSRYLKSISLTELQQEEWEASSEAWWRCGLNFLCLLQTGVKADFFPQAGHVLLLPTYCIKESTINKCCALHNAADFSASECPLLCLTLVERRLGTPTVFGMSPGFWVRACVVPKKPSWLNWALFCLALPLVCTEGSAPLDLMAIPCFHRRQEKCGPKLVKKNPIRLVLSLV